MFVPAKCMLEYPFLYNVCGTDQ